MGHYFSEGQNRGRGLPIWSGSEADPLESRENPEVYETGSGPGPARHLGDV